MPIKPPISCPPNYDILNFRFTDYKRVGVVKGIDTMSNLDMSSLTIPIQEHREGTLTLKANSTKQINIDDVADYWPMYEVYSFNANIAAYPGVIGNYTTHNYTLFDYQNQTELLNFDFTVNPSNDSYKDFETAFLTAFQEANGANYVGLDVAQSSTTGVFSILSATLGARYRHTFTFDSTDEAGGPYIHPGNLITPYTKYPNGGIKYLLLYPKYDLVDTSTCGCGDQSGNILTNDRYIQYVGQTEYLKKTITSTPIYVNAGAIGTYILTWDGSLSNDHIGYYINVGDMISASADPLYRAVVTAINGYIITVDQPIISSLTSDAFYINKVESPATPQYKNIGDFFFASGTTDVYDTDNCYTETVILKNPHSFDVPISYMIGR